MQRQTRNEFINNIISSDYTLCFRGSGNYSLRFYETLCLGRIPLFIDTDCKLPFQNEIDWKSLCLWVNVENLENICEIIIDYHNSISEKKFIEKQLYCREVWVKYLSKEVFFGEQFYNYLSG